MDHRIILSGIGGTQRLCMEDYEAESPGDGQVRIRHAAIGVNFIDIYQRQGLYPLPQYPAVLGVEGAGTVEAIGIGVNDLAPGDRVAYAGGAPGSYATTRLLPRNRLFRLPDEVSAEAAAASMLKGITAHMLLRDICQVRPNDLILVQAAAGGLGGIVTRWAVHLGAIVIGVVGSAQKALLAKAHGAQHVIVGRHADLKRSVEELTRGQGAKFAIDGVGGDTLLETIACVRPFGIVCSIGQVAGPIPLLDVNALGPQRSLSLARPSVMAYAADLPRYSVAAEAVTRMVAQGIVPTTCTKFTLEDAPKAHSALESGDTRGSVILVPE